MCFVKSLKEMSEAICAIKFEKEDEARCAMESFLHDLCSCRLVLSLFT